MSYIVNQEAKKIFIRELIAKAIYNIRDAGQIPCDSLDFLRGAEGAPCVVSEHADKFISGDATEETTLECARKIAIAIAILSFEPGGIDFFDTHYESAF